VSFDGPNPSPVRTESSVGRAFQASRTKAAAAESRGHRHCTHDDDATPRLLHAHRADGQDHWPLAEMFLDIEGAMKDTKDVDIVVRLQEVRDS
jgi:hypothetical protein